MSWFTEIAGKAEDLLNKVDKTAATALQNKAKYASSVDIRHDVSPNFNNRIPTVNPNLTMAASTANISKIGAKSHINANLSPRKSKNLKDDDEKLLEFLNSSEPVSENCKQDDQVLKSVTGDSSNGILIQDLSNSEAIEIESPTELNANTSAVDVIMHEVQQGDMIHGQKIVSEDTLLQKSDDILLNNESNDLPVVNDGNSHVFKDELILVKKRADHAEAEFKRMQKKLEHYNSQISGNDKLVRGLQEREVDLMTALEAKDSQLAVLKVRLEEADQEVKNNVALIHDLKVENERLQRDHTDTMSLQNQIVHNLKEKLSETDAELNKIRESYRSMQTEQMALVGKLEEEKRHLAESIRNLQKKCGELTERNREQNFQIQNGNRNLENLQQEYSDYKVKAQRALQFKEKLIASLKDSSLDIETGSATDASYAVLSAEAESIKHERDLLREEIKKANETIEEFRINILEVEAAAQNDTDSAHERCKHLEEQLYQEKQLKEEVHLLNNQLKEELRFLQEDSSRIKDDLQSRIKDREIEIEKLRKQLTTKSLSTVSQTELESRLRALTENLIQKQTIVEALSTEKNSLVLQLERVEQQLKEAQLYGSQHHHTVIGVNNSDSERKQKMSTYLENPFDSTLTRKVKRMYSCIDAFSIRLGIFFRRYPVARVFIIVYMFLLHLWVLIVLLTYEPEVHNM